MIDIEWVVSMRLLKPIAVIIIITIANGLKYLERSKCGYIIVLRD